MESVRTMQKNPIILIAVFLVLLGVSGVLLFLRKQANNPSGITPTPSAAVVSTTPGKTSPTNAVQEANITVIAPNSGETVHLPLIITGQARVFENSVSYRITDGSGKTLNSGFTMADSPDMGKFGPYTITIQSLDGFTEGKMTIEVFQNSAKDGSEIDKVVVPVTLE